MTARTVVWVYAVGDVGVTGEPIGWATLVEPSYALMDPRPEPSADPPAGPVRVAVVTDGGAWVELFDATAHVLDDATDLVLLELAGSTFAPVVSVPIGVGVEDDPLASFLVEPSREQLIAGLRQVMAAAPPPPELPAIPVEGLLEVLRRLLHPGP